MRGAVAAIAAINPAAQTMFALRASAVVCSEQTEPKKPAGFSIGAILLSLCRRLSMQFEPPHEEVLHF
ncbi:MAG: hypothetical protein LBL83_03615 [Clostridiales bacterium]|nr:hypothetical protein [Clostridiales bacterium]